MLPLNSRGWPSLPPMQPEPACDQSSDRPGHIQPSLKQHLVGASVNPWWGALGTGLGRAAISRLRPPPLPHPNNRGFPCMVAAAGSNPRPELANVVGDHAECFAATPATGARSCIPGRADPEHARPRRASFPRASCPTAARMPPRLGLDRQTDGGGGVAEVPGIPRARASAAFACPGGSWAPCWGWSSAGKRRTRDSVVPSIAWVRRAGLRTGFAGPGSGRVPCWRRARHKSGMTVALGCQNWAKEHGAEKGKSRAAMAGSGLSASRVVSCSRVMLRHPESVRVSPSATPWATQV